METDCLYSGDIVRHTDGRIGVFNSFREQPDMGGYIVGVFFPSDRKRRSVGQIIYCRFKDIEFLGSIYEKSLEYESRFSQKMDQTESPQITA